MELIAFLVVCEVRWKSIMKPRLSSSMKNSQPTCGLSHNTHFEPYSGYPCLQLQQDVVVCSQSVGSAAGEHSNMSVVVKCAANDLTGIDASVPRQAVIGKTQEALHLSIRECFW